MSTIQVSCIDQVLTMTNTPVIASGGIKEDRVAFTFCPMWDGFYKTAVFWRTEDEVYNQVLDDTNSCDIPPEVLGTEGVLYFGVFGVNDAEAQRTSEVLRYTIERGAITDGGKPSDPTPDIYTQLLAKIAAMGDNKGKADKVSSATEGNFAGLDANGNLTDSGVKASDFIPATEKGVAGGVASLDEAGKVPADQLPSMDYVPTSEKGVAGGVATLGTDGKVPSEQLPSLDYVKKTGDTMTGDLQLISSNAVTFHASDANWSSDPWFSLARQGHSLKVTVRNNGLNRLFYFNDNTAELKDALTLWYYDDGSEHKATFLHTGNLSEYNMDWVSVWPVPFSYDGLTVFTISNVEKVVTLPEPIDCSKYYYDFRITVYGLMRKGDTKNTSILADVELVYNTSAVDGETIYDGTKLTSLTTTEATEDLASDLSWASIYRKEIETLPPNGFLTSIGEGSKGGVIKTYGQDYSITTSDLLGAKVYDKLLITFGTVSSGTAIQTFGIKFEYRKTRKKG